MKKQFKKEWIGITTVALLTLSGKAYAGCSDKASTIIQASAAFASLIPTVGTAASAGTTITGMFVCGSSANPEYITPDQVTDIILAVLDEQVADAIERDTSALVADILDLGDKLQGTSYTNSTINEMSDYQIDHIITLISILLTNIHTSESQFVASLTRSYNTRQSYDLTPAIVLANYKLGLIQLNNTVSPGANRNNVATALETILDDFAAYKTESNRLRDITYYVSVDSGNNKRTYTLKAKRGGPHGKSLDTHTSQCTGSYCRTGDQALAGYESVFANKYIAPLDEQDRQIDFIIAKAKALQEDSTTALETVETEHVTHTLIGSLNSNAIDNCIYNRKGKLKLNGEYQDGVLRMRRCSPATSRQNWIFKENGQIQTSIANMCIQANYDDDRTYVKECKKSSDDDFSTQVWTRVDNQLRVEINSEQRCISLAPGHTSSTERNLQVLPCKDIGKQNWLVYSPLQNGEDTLVQTLGFNVLNPTIAEHLGVSEDLIVDEDDESSVPLCLFISFFGRLAECDRFELPQLYAHDKNNRLHSLKNPIEVVIAADDNRLSLRREYYVDNSEGVFVRNGDYFERADDEFLKIYALEQKSYSSVVVGVPTDYEMNLAKWKHFNGGKFETAYE